MCPQMLEMRTDPQNFDYLCVSGCRRDIRTWDMEDNGQVAFTDSAERARIDTDPMYKLEKAKSDKNVHEDRKPDLKRIQIDNFQKMGDNFELNRALRAGLRYAKKMDAGPTADETAFAKGIFKNFYNFLELVTLIKSLQSQEKVMAHLKVPS